jgi:hypothetical protein
MASVQSGVILDNSRVSGTATLFEGSKIQAQGFSRLHLNNGTRLDLATGAQVQVFATHASLDAGSGEIEGSGYELDARTLRIRLTEKNTIARVKIDSNAKRVYVAAVNAPVDVRNSDGLLIARVAPGTPFAFVPQAAASNGFDMYGCVMYGCVLQKNGAAIASDSTGSIVSELRGYDLRNAVGKSTHIVGSIDPSATPVAGAGSVIKVTSATYSPKGSCTVIASRLGASTLSASLRPAATSGAGAATMDADSKSGSGEGQAGANAGGGQAGGSAGGGQSGGGGSTGSGPGWGKKAAIIGGIAAATAATLGGLAAAGVIFSSSANLPTQVTAPTQTGSSP